MRVDRLAGPERFVCICELRLQVNGAGRGVDLIVDQSQVAVGQNRFIVHRIGDDFKRLLALGFCEFRRGASAGTLKLTKIGLICVIVTRA